MTKHKSNRWIVKRRGNFARLANTFLITLLLSAILPARSAFAQETLPANYTFQECDQVEEATLWDELNRITQSVFAEELGGMGVAEIVKLNWVALNLDATVDEAVASATEKVMEETGFWDRFRSGWSPTKAEELTTEVATYAFGSSDFREALDLLSSDITDDVVAEIRLITTKSASSALLCCRHLSAIPYHQRWRVYWKSNSRPGSTSMLRRMRM